MAPFDLLGMSGSPVDRIPGWEDRFDDMSVGIEPCPLVYVRSAFDPCYGVGIKRLV
jgi:hypothetical protein